MKNSLINMNCLLSVHHQRHRAHVIFDVLMVVTMKNIHVLGFIPCSPVRNALALQGNLLPPPTG
jgi:hypothetical protein